MSLWIFSTRSSWDQAGKECPECEENSFNFLSGECNSKRLKNPKIAKERSFCRKYVPFRAKWKFSRIRAFVAPGWYKGKEVGKNSKHFQYVGESWGRGLNPISYPIQQYLYAYMYVCFEISNTALKTSIGFLGKKFIWIGFISRKMRSSEFSKQSSVALVL